MGKFADANTYDGIIAGGQKQEESKKQRGRNKTQETMSSIVLPLPENNRINLSPKPEKQLSEEHEEPKPQKKYLRLDVTDCQEYIYLMAQHQSNVSGKHVSMTQYILQLIKADKEKNQELYYKLKSIEQLKQELV